LANVRTLILDGACDAQAPSSSCLQDGIS
jgi:hypothetical protein